MKKRYDPNFEMDSITLYPGEFYATTQSELITTLLGSCISVVLIDPVNKVSGMNHFILPGTYSCEPVMVGTKGKYGIFAMDLLIDEMVSLGCSKKYLLAKVFGGGSVLQIYSGSTKSVSEENIRFVMNYLSNESIPVVSSDIGGLEGRVIYFFTEGEGAYVKKIESQALQLNHHQTFNDTFRKPIGASHE